MNKVLFVIAVLIEATAVLIMTPAVYAADCIYNGRAYPPGTTVGSLVCQADGTWKEQ